LGSNTLDRPHSAFLKALRCPTCGGALQAGDEPPAGTPGGGLRCPACGEDYQVAGGIPRMLLPALREAMDTAGGRGEPEALKAATGRSFGYEWSKFPEVHAEYERNFLDYHAPHGPGFFRKKRVLDAGCGSGRHAYYSAKYGAEVWAVDLGPAVEVAHRNNRGLDSVHVVQADLYNLPFEPESFDYVYSLGVLHHLPDPEGGFRNLLRYLKPGGEVRIYLYWQAEGQPLKRALLAATSALRCLTVRLPYWAVYALAYPAAVAAFAVFVWPYRLLRRIPGLSPLAERIVMRQYGGYPFRVCVNDQFDRLSAPIENRYTKAQVVAWLERGGLEDVRVIPNFGWVASGRKPSKAPA
jgi:SAM-dependent methyltransferase/uncharacterized protein YbaR (Trm112 family)